MWSILLYCHNEQLFCCEWSCVVHVIMKKQLCFPRIEQCFNREYLDKLLVVFAKYLLDKLTCNSIYK